MKKFKSFVALLLVAVMMTGCMKAEFNLKIAKDDVTISYIMGIQKEYVGMMGDQDPVKEERADAEKAGFKVSDYSDDKYQGIKATKSLGKLEDLTTKDEIGAVEFDPTSENGIGKIFKVDDNGNYTAKLKVNAMDDIENGMNEDEDEDEDEDETADLEDGVSATGTEDTVGATNVEEDDDDLSLDDDVMPTENEGGSGMDMEALKKSMDVKFIVEVSGKVGKNNATTVEGNKLIWNLVEFKGEALEFEFTLEEESGFPMLYLIIGGAVLLLIIIIVIIALSKKKKPQEVESAPLAAAPIPEVEAKKESVLTPVNPTNVEAPALTPVATPEVKVEAPAVTVEPPKVEEPVVTVEPTKVEIPEVKVEAPTVTVETPEEAKTE